MPGSHENRQGRGVLSTVGNWWKKWTGEAEEFDSDEPTDGKGDARNVNASAAKWPVWSTPIVLSIERASQSEPEKR